MITSNRNQPTARQHFHEIRTTTDFIDVSDSGDLLMEKCRAVDIVREYGSPVYVVSESTLRANYRRIRDAFQSRWSAEVNILYAIKANNNLAVRAIMAEEGAGGDCFGEAELYATFLGGADPEKVVMNGSSKTEAEIRRAVELNVRVNVDAEDEIAILRRVAADTGIEVRANLRLKIAPADLDQFGSDYFGIPAGSGVKDFLEHEKWGFSAERAVELIQELRETPGVVVDGYNVHMGRLARDPQAYFISAAELGKTVRRLHESTGFWPRLLDIGGGWARERDPEARTLDLNPHSIESYADATCSALQTELEGAGGPIPELWLEPGRYIAGNAVTLLATVGAVKKDAGSTWVHVDASTNNLMRVDTSGSRYHIVPAQDMNRLQSMSSMVVGPTCVHSVLGVGRRLPEVKRGEILAILDAGMYAETTSTQFNGVPRPATVLVSGSRLDLIKERETIQDVFHKHRIPERLRARTARTA